MIAFLLSLAAVGAILLLAAAVGWMLAAALFPGGRSFRAERLGWGLVLGCALLAAMVPMSFVVGVTPGWIPFVLLAVLALAAAHFLPLPLGDGDRSLPLPVGEGRGEGRALSLALLALLLLGIALYALRALTEPMWSNDYLAIWGFKGKTIFGARALPERLLRWPALGFSHPEYPLGLPFLYAGLSFLLGRWDDHAMALLFPFFQVATLLVLFGWLRRRGAPWPLPLAAAALLALFEPLYSGFLTGMAEVPLACGMLLFGTAFSDALDSTVPPLPPGLWRASCGAPRRLAAASLLIAATKNEGLFLAVVAALVAGILMARRHSVRWTVSAAALLPALAVTLLRRLTLGSVPLRDFDLSFLAPWGIEGLLPRLGESVRAALSEVVLPAWPGLLCVTALFAVGRRTPHADLLLILVALCLAAYLFLPALAVAGPTWLVQTTLARTVAALAPLVAAGVTGRLRGSPQGEAGGWGSRVTVSRQHKDEEHRRGGCSWTPKGTECTQVMSGKEFRASWEGLACRLHVERPVFAGPQNVYATRKAGSVTPLAPSQAAGENYEILPRVRIPKWKSWLIGGNLKTRTVVSTLALCLVAGAVCFASPQMGTWKLNEAKSKLAPGVPKNHTVVYEAAGDNVKVTVDGTDPAGKPTHNEWTGKFDGKDYPVTGDPNSDARSYKTVDASTLELTGKKDGKITFTGRVVVSADGKTRTVTVSGTDPQGKSFTGSAVYDKQ